MVDLISRLHEEALQTICVLPYTRNLLTEAANALKAAEQQRSASLAAEVEKFTAEKADLTRDRDGWLEVCQVAEDRVVELEAEIMALRQTIERGCY